jgi:hypothetical protein
MCPKWGKGEYHPIYYRRAEQGREVGIIDSTGNRKRERIEKRALFYSHILLICGI